MCALRDSLPQGRRPGIQVGISTAFGCTLEGNVSEDNVIELARGLAEVGADYRPLRHDRLRQPGSGQAHVQALRQEIGEKAGGAHFHNTRGQGLANIVAALDAGVTTFDSSQVDWAAVPTRLGATGTS